MQHIAGSLVIFTLLLLRPVNGCYSRSFNSDSLAVIHFFQEGSRFSRINSDSSFAYFGKAFELSLKTGSPELISLARKHLGDYFLNREMYQESMSHYLESLAIAEKSENGERVPALLDALGSVYYYMEVFDKSFDYHTKALNIYMMRQDTAGQAKVLSHLGLLHSSREFCEQRTREQKFIDFQTAIDHHIRAADLYTMIGDADGIARENQNIAAVYNKLEKPAVSLGFIQKSLEYYRQKDDPEGLSGTLFTLGRTYYRLKEFDKSIQAFRESEEIAKKGNLTGGIQYLYESMAMPYYDVGDYQNAYNCYIKYMTIRDSVYNSEKSRQIIELETAYQSEVKENEILRLKTVKRNRTTMLYLLAGVIILLGSSIYYYKKLVTKNRIISEQNIQIREERILDLEKEKQLLATRSVLKGEEAERSRLAYDLHNGLGGLLSGIKINLSSMKENFVLSHENASAFSHAISLLDTSISELRRVAHNLMPETLNHYGLKTAIEDFCTQVSPAGPPNIRLQFFGDEIRYTKELELTVYRIIQELVNNSLKHAAASRINVQLFTESKRVAMQVTDNGRGFDYSKIEKERKGKGFENINARITAAGGKMDVWSRDGEGTEISVEIQVS